MAATRQRRARKDRTGRTQRRHSATARSRKPNLSRYYGRKLPSVVGGDFEFTLTLIRPKGKKSVNLDKLVESFEWSDEEAALTGNLQLRRPVPERPSSLPIQAGHQVRCRVKWHGRWYELWTMRCEAPDTTLVNAATTVALKDDMDKVRRGRRHYVFRATKRRKHGWFGHDALRVAAKREGIRLGKIAKCRKRTKKIDVRGSFLDLAIKIYSDERDSTGGRYVLRIRNGKFEVVPYRRNKHIFVLKNQILDGSLSRPPKKAKPVTVLIGRGRIGKGKKAKKIHHTEYRRSMVRAFGHMEKEKDYGKVKSVAELKRKIKRDLADEYKVDTNLTIQHAGIPFIERGEGVQVSIAQEGFKGKKSFVYCTAARHQVASTYTSEFEFTVDDPFEKDRERAEKFVRDKKRAERKKKKRKAGN